MTSTSFGGSWTEQKLEILRRYLDAYTTALKRTNFRLIYVDAFAGEGYWRPDAPERGDGQQIIVFSYLREDYEDFEELRSGSAKIALTIEDRPFDHFLFIEKDPERCGSLERLQAEFPNRSVDIRNGDANEELHSFCDQLGNHERAVVFLDPFATEVSWETVARIAATRKIDCWILFPLMAVARQMPTDAEPTEAWATNLDRIFGGRDYWKSLYQTTTLFTFFGDEEIVERPGRSGPISDAYRVRLEEVFEKVAPTRRVFTNSKNSQMFDLFFAASNRRGAPIAIEIADHILRNW